MARAVHCDSRRATDRQLLASLNPSIHRNPINRPEFLLRERNAQHFAPTLWINPSSPNIGIDEFPLLVIPAVGSSARPIPISGIAHHASLYRIPLDVAECVPRVLLAHLPGVHATFPTRSATTTSRVEHFGVALVQLSKTTTDPLRALGNDHEMHVIRHEAESTNAHFVALGQTPQHSEVVAAINVRLKEWHLLISSVRDVIRNANLNIA
jgi:hypothetical protein